MNLKKIIRKFFSTQIYGMPVSPKERLKLTGFLLSSEYNWLLNSPQRHFHAFCVGLPRSGTHTIGYMFDKYYAAAHEPNNKETIINIMDWDCRKYTKAKMLNILSFRDKYLKLELESSHYLHHIIDLLIEQFPHAKFILTVREPMSWLESEVNQNYKTRNGTMWRSLEQHRYSQYNYEYEFSNLANVKNIYPIRSYLSYWKDHISTVLCNVPSEQLLVIDTFDLSHEISHIASFLGVDSETIDINMKHSGKRDPAFNLYDNVDRNKVSELVQIYCQEFIQENLPFMKKYLNQ